MRGTPIARRLAPMANLTPRNAAEIPFVVVAALNAGTSAVLNHAVEELQHAREMAGRDLQEAIAAFRNIFVNAASEARSGSLLRQAWAVHQTLEVVRSLDAALAHLQQERTDPRSSSFAA